MASAPTKTDVAAAEWSIRDDCIRLRRWGTDRSHELPSLPIDPWLLGTAETCALRLTDRLVSHEHARLLREHGMWSLRDLGSKNGLRQDGALCAAFMLKPGVEIGIGATTLIAESRGSIALHGFLARLLGWSSDRIDAVDHALRSLRLAATRRTALTLYGESDLVPIAHALHRHTLGANRPFVMCDPRRTNARESVRSAANYVSGLAGFEAARGGSLCVRGYRLPSDFPAVLARLREPRSRVQLIVCAERHADDGTCLTAPIEVPPLEGRADELRRIVDEYAFDAAAALDAPPATFTEAERSWVLTHASSSLSEIEKATLRLIALGLSTTLVDAAARLGMTPVSLSKWIGRRKAPPRLAP